MHRKWFATFMTLTLLVVNLCSPAAGHADADAGTVNISGGSIRGANINGIWTYLGVPYAAPPVGDLRWKEPQPVKAWEGIRDCLLLSAACPQPKTLLYDAGNTDEDCLYLNVWTPARNPAEKLPVMVWIHGGSFITGSASQKMYDGLNLAKHDVIVVSINYRLGPLGFLSHPLLSKESAHGVSGNYGLLDQIYALKWVQANIAALGGDPGNVTIWGESAGALSVCDLMISPLAKGLFHRAISQSGSFSDAYPINRDDTVVKAEQTGSELARELGCDTAGDILAAMRKKTAEEIIQAAFKRYEVNTGTRFRPVVDGWVIPSNPWSLFSNGKQASIPMLIGTNTDEGTIFVYADTKALNMGAQDYEGLVKSIYKENGAAVLSAFPVNRDLASPPAPLLGWKRIIDLLWYPDAAREDVPATFARLRAVMSFFAGALHAADTVTASSNPVYVYRFARVPNTPLKVLGSFHGLELFYVFGNFNADRISIPLDKTDMDLSQSIMKYWSNFARTGNPNSPGLPSWPVYTRTSGEYVELGDVISAQTGFLSQYHDLVTKVTPP